MYRAVVAGLIYIIVIEGVLNTFASVLQLLTVNYYFRVLVVRWLDPPDSRAWALTLDTAPRRTALCTDPVGSQCRFRDSRRGVDDAEGVSREDTGRKLGGY